MALGRFFHRVAMSVYVWIYISICLSPFHVSIFEASHWPSGHMIRSQQVCLLEEHVLHLQFPDEKNVILLVLLSTSGERFFVSRMRDF